MTKEEVKDEIHNGIYGDQYTHINKIIDMIYDSFDKRTCGNCKHYKSSEGCLKIIISEDYSQFGSIKEYLSVSRDFGCNKFERKEK